MAPRPPYARTAPAEPWRSSLTRGLYTRRDGLRPLVAPAGQAGRPAPGPAAGAHDEDVVGALEEPPPRRRVGGLGGTRQPGGPLEVGDGAARVVAQEGLDLAAAPAALPHGLPVLAGPHQQRPGESPPVWDPRG